MKRLLFTIFVLTLSFAVKADEMRLSDSLPCKYLGSLYYGENVGYQLNFETEDLNLLQNKGEGKLISVTLVVPRQGNKANALPEGTFSLGPCDSLSIYSLDYYGCNVQYYGKFNDTYDKPDIRCSFLQCRITIVRVKKGFYNISVEYELNNGEQGVYTYSGKIKMTKKDARAKFNFLPEEKRIKNWQLTDAKLELRGETAFSSREAMLKFICADEIFGMAVVYLPVDSIYGHYVMRYGHEVGSCEPSTGGFDEKGYYNLFNTGIEEDSSGFIYYPETGFIDISEGKLFFEFTTRDGSVVRGCYYGDIKLLP